MTPSTLAPAVLAWDHAVADIPAEGLSVQRTAEPGECERIARALDLLGCTFSLDYAIVPSGFGRYRLTGTLMARVEQACGVTLEPVASTIEERLDLRFWPAADIPAPTSGEVDLDGEEDPEPIVEERIGVGRVAFECLAAAIDPFPRKPEAALERSSTGGEEALGKADSPFAVLANLRPKG
jgi:uncharacterized metal-binding protein YceD (DUF177 family)